MTAATSATGNRPPLSRQRVLEAAVELADREGLDSLTMRRLGAELGVEAMALYKHVANKDEILDGMVEVVVAEIEVSAPGSAWREAMRQRAVSARQVLKRHPWAIGLMESRERPGPATLRYLDAVIANLRHGGFSMANAAHAFWLLDSYVYGHVIQEISLPFETSEQTAGKVLDQADMVEYAHLVELAADAVTSGYEIETEFEFGLELILDTLDRIRA